MSAKEQKHSENKVSPKQHSPKPITSSLETATKQPVQPTALFAESEFRPSSLSASSVLQLQRVAGNRAVSQLLAPTVQRQQLHSVENNTGLPNDLKTGVENLSGLDVSDVRVHKNSSQPEQIGALAYTEGTDIHLGPGQEKYLPHEAWHVVQQKQGRVASTRLLKGINLNDSDTLEKEADIMGAKALSDAGRIPSSLTLSQQKGDTKVRQCAFGIEIEIPSAIHSNSTPSGTIVPGDTPIIDYGDYKIVSDKRKSAESIHYSNIEFVTKKIDEYENSSLPRGQAHAAFDAYVKPILDKIYTEHQQIVSAGKTINGYTLGNVAKTAFGINNYGRAENELFVHYTGGFTLSEFRNFTQTTLRTPANRNGNRDRAVNAINAARDVVALLKTRSTLTPQDEQKIEGYIELVAMHIHAFLDQVIDDDGQPKNKIGALSRVPLGDVFASLPGNIQTLLYTNFSDIDQTIADNVDTGGHWNDDHKRQIKSSSPVIKLGDYMKSAFGRHGTISQQDVFGGMSEKSVESVNGRSVIPVELRTLYTARPDWPTFRNEAKNLFTILYNNTHP